MADLTAFSTFTQMRRADIYKFVGNDPRSVRAIEELQNLLSGNVPQTFSSILGTSIIAGNGLTDGGTLNADVTLNVGAGTGISVTADAVNIADTGVTAATYGDATHVAQVTFNAQGQATAASSVALHLPNTVTFQASGGAAPGTTFDGSGAVIVDYHTIGAQAAGSYLTSNQTITLSGDATGSGTTAITVTLAASGVTAGSYTNANITVDAKGRVTAASNGTGGSGGTPWDYSPPTAASFPTLTSGDSTNLTLTDDSNEGLLVDSGTLIVYTGGNDRFRTATKTLPSSGAADWEVRMKFKNANPGSNNTGVGLVALESATNKQCSVIFNVNGNPTFYAARGTLTTWPANFTSAAAMRCEERIAWMRFVYVNSTGTLSAYWGVNGKQWQLLGSTTNATVFTTRADRVGVVVQTNTSGGNNYMSVPYWYQSF